MPALNPPAFRGIRPRLRRQLLEEAGRLQWRVMRGELLCEALRTLHEPRAAEDRALHQFCVAVELLEPLRAKPNPTQVQRTVADLETLRPVRAPAAAWCRTECWGILVASSAAP